MEGSAGWTADVTRFLQDIPSKPYLARHASDVSASIPPQPSARADECPCNGDTGFGENERRVTIA